MRILLHIRRIFSLFMILFLLAAAGGAVTTLASPKTPGTPDRPVVVRMYYTGEDHLNQVAGSLDIWEVHEDEGFVIVQVKPEQYAWLQNLGYTMEIDAEKTAELRNPEALLDPHYAYFDNHVPNALNNYMVDFMQQVNADYPDLVEMIDIGDAWEGENGGYARDIWVMRVTNEDPAYGAIEDKPVFYLHGGIHAREVTIPELLIRYTKFLTSGYNGLGGYSLDPDVTWLVNHHTVYVLITTNPDGHVINELNSSAWWRKNVDNNDGCTWSDSWGVDLNRNHSFKWGCCGGSSGDPCDETYRGSGRASEPETAAFQNHVLSVIPDQNGPNGDDELPPAAPEDTTGIILTMHSYGNLTLLPWGAVSLPDPANMPELTKVGHKLAYFTGYTDFDLGYVTDGGTRDWGYGKLGVPTYTFEVGPGYGECGSFFPDYDCIDGTNGAPENFWAENRPAFLYAHKIAVTPYRTAYGPDSQNLIVTPSTVPQGTPVTLNANLADHRCCGEPLSPIAGAEYFIDAPGDDGTGTAMTPLDGSWGETNEDGTAIVSTSSLAPGQHYILVHSRNSSGDWGPFTAVFVNTTPAGPPTAGFTFSPDQPQAGETIQFTDTSSASPTEFFWDFGDGMTSSQENPSHIFTSVDVFTVTHTVTNPLGSDTIVLPVQVLPVDVAGVELTLETTETLYSGDTAYFSALLSPDTAAPPFNYIINFGDSTEIAGTTNDLNLTFNHLYATGGIFTATIKVWNNTMPPAEAVTDSVQVTVIQIHKLYLPFVSR
jgi:hypothetical protein